MRSPRSVTMQPIGMFSRSLKFAIALRERVTTGFWPVIVGHLLDRRIEQLHVLDRLAEAHVEDDLLEPRHLERGSCSPISFCSGRHDVLVDTLLQSRNHRCRPSPHRSHVCLAAATADARRAAPSSSRASPIRAGALHRSHMIMRFERWIGASFSTMPPGALRAARACGGA